MKTLVIFSHGKESGPWGSKIQLLAKICQEMGAEVMSPDYRDIPDDPDARVSRLLSLDLPPHDILILAGSSMGGYVACIASQNLVTHGLFLMAPALGITGFGKARATTSCSNISVVAGWKDDLIPMENIFNFSRDHCAELHCLDAGHRLEEINTQLQEIFRNFLDKIYRQYG